MLSFLVVLVQARPNHKTDIYRSDHGSNNKELFEEDTNYDYPSISGYENPGITFVHKHIYVHVPPPELEEEHQETKPISVPPNEKHYKIIFIKAPNPPVPTVPVIPPLPVNEEKTIVYVLVKKPDEAPKITVPTAAPTLPSKPEVYFIRYKSNKVSSEDSQTDVSYGENGSDGQGDVIGDLNVISEYGPLKGGY